MTTMADAPNPSEARPQAAPLGWRTEFSRANAASLTTRIVFPLAACATLLPFVSPGIALMLGIILALTWGNAYVFTTARLVTPLLQISVIGLGAGMNLIEVGHAGVHGFFYTVIGITLTMTVGLALGRLIKTERDTSLLVTVGTAICGGSAIAAIAPATRAKSHEVSVALATVFFLNAVALFIFPWIGHRFSLSQAQFGVWSALAIHDTSSVVGAAMQYGARALEIATTIKLTRALWIVPVTLGVGMVWNRGNPDAPAGKAKRPWFILGFLAAAGIGDMGSGPEAGRPCGLRRRTAFVSGHLVFDRFRTEPRCPSDGWPAILNPGLCALGADGHRHPWRNPVGLDRLAGREGT